MKQSTLLLAIAAPIWALAIGVGTYVLMAYEHTPGVAASHAPSVFPKGTQLVLASDRATLIMLVHPHCPCTRASIAELAKLLARCPNQLSAYVVFLKPESMPQGWEQTDIWESCRAIPGVQMISDTNGEIAERLDAATSGQTFVYSSKGALIFAGGITASRGQVGDNVGSQAIVEKLNGRAPALDTASVFGCPLVAPQTVDQVEHDTGGSTCPGK